MSKWKYTNNDGKHIINNERGVLIAMVCDEDVAIRIVAEHQENERLRKDLEEKESLAEKRMLESQDWEDEYHALKRRYEELDKSALEKHELLMDTAAKYQAVSKELEEAWTTIRRYGITLMAAKHLSKEIDHTGAPKDTFTFRAIAKNMKMLMSLVDWKAIDSLTVGQEGEGNKDAQG